MPPTDSTPSIKTASASFEHLYSLNAYNKIPLHEYKSTKTGLTVIVAEVDGPVVNGYFCLVTEALDDDGLPHTLEHLVFLGSEEYPYKGVLDLLANRCLASGTNAWTDVDHTCYTMETAGSEGFLTLLPIYMDHILYPILSDEGFVTEVHHITGDGENAGVVYCEMQGRENSAESRMHLNMSRKIYPGKCGYSSETGGIMKNLRESCNNTKVRNYHKEFYRPENLKLIITGQIKPEEIFQALEKVEEKILSKGARGEFTRPWQRPVPPFDIAEDVVVKYPADEENNGMFGAAWRGPSAVNDQYSLLAVSILMKYLSELSVSPLQKAFVETPEPYASKVSFGIQENAESCIYFYFHNVPSDKIALIKPKLIETLKDIADNDKIIMDQLKNIIHRHMQESLSNVEVSPHHTVAFMVIGHMLYGNTKEDLEQRVNPLIDLEKMLNEPIEFWINLLKKYFIEGKQLTIQGIPSIEEQAAMAAEEKARIEQQIKELGETGLKEKDEILEKAITYNERPPPATMLQSVPIPGVDSISFHNIERFFSESTDKSRIDLTHAPVYTFFDHIKSNFVYMFATLDTSKVSEEQRLYLPILLESLIDSSLTHNGALLSREEAVVQMSVDLVSWTASFGLGGGKAASFKCGSHSQTAILMLQVESGKFEKGIAWLRDFLYETIFEVDALKIIANKMVNHIAQLKRNGRSMVGYVMKAMTYTQESNIQANGILRQHAFLTKLLTQLDSSDAENVLTTFDSIRKLITAPENVALYFAGNLELVKNPADALEEFLPKLLKESAKQQKLNITPDYTLLLPKLETNSPPNCIIGMGCLESSFFYQGTPSIKDYNDPDLPALLLYIQYLIQCEGPLWKQVRGKGLSYGYTISLKINEGLLYLVFVKSTNVVGAYNESWQIVSKQLQEKTWDMNLFESAKSSLIFELIDEEKTIGSAISLSLSAYFQKVDYKYNRHLLTLIDKVTIEDLNRVGDKYVANLFEPSKVKTAIVCDPCKAEEIKEGFDKLNHKLEVYPSLEESFLKNMQSVVLP